MCNIYVKIHLWQEPPVVRESIISAQQAIHSIAMPIFTQEKNIAKILGLVFKASFFNNLAPIYETACNN
jgi:hypothetical protein